jgi:hypothetical protein
MSSLELGFSAVRNPRSSAVSRIHAHNFLVNTGGKAENPFPVFASTFENLRLPLFFGWVLITVGRLVVSVGQLQIQNHHPLQIPYIPLRRSLALFV